MTDSTDIVERLRAYNKVASYDAVALVNVQLLNEAADTISSQRQTIERMREAAEWLMAKEKDDFASLDHSDICDVLYGAFDVFRAALKGEKE